METKQAADKLEKLRTKLGFSNSSYWDPEGRSGGLSLWWREDCKLKIVYKSANIIDTWIEDEGGGWHFTVVYGNPRRERRI